MLFILGLLLGGLSGMTVAVLMINHTNDQLLRENKKLLEELQQRESVTNIINQNSKVMLDSIAKADELIRLTKEYGYIFCSAVKRQG